MFKKVERIEVLAKRTRLTNKWASQIKPNGFSKGYRWQF